MSKNRRVKDDGASWWAGCLPTPCGWIKLRTWFSLLQCKYLPPNHFPDTHALKTSHITFITYYNQTAKLINWTYTIEKLEQKLGKHYDNLY